MLLGGHSLEVQAPAFDSCSPRLQLCARVVSIPGGALVSPLVVVQCNTIGTMCIGRGGKSVLATRFTNLKDFVREKRERRYHVVVVVESLRSSCEAEKKTSSDDHEAMTR